MDSLSKEVADSLIKSGFKSPFYRPLMKKLTTTKEWNAIKDIVAGATQITLSDQIVDIRQADDIWRLNLIGINDNIYLLIEGLNSNFVYLAEFIDESFYQRIVCSFENVVKEN